MPNPYFFGYGSLVNQATHDYRDARPARLSGWRRAWVHTGARDIAFLTAYRSPGAQIDGLIAAVPGADWAALDARESAYDRLGTEGQVAHDLDLGTEISVYSVPEQDYQAVTDRHPVLLSYLDVVVQGYLQVFGLQGVAEFFATTDGWDAPILDDRATPRYPRHQMLKAEERDLVDHHLAQVSARLLRA